MLRGARSSSRKRLALAVCFLSVASLGRAEVETRNANNGNVVLEAVPEVPASIIEALNRYQSVRSASFEDWSEDGESIFIRTRFGNTTQLHHVAIPGGARRQLTFFPEPVGATQRRPDTGQLQFGMDVGGGEFYQLFLLDLESGDSRMLTDGESRNSSATWSHDGKWLAFQSTRRNGKSNDVWMMQPEEPESARMIFESPDGSSWSPAEFDRTGERLLIQNYISITDSRIHLHDTTSGETRLLRGAAAPASVNLATEFDRDGEGFYLITDQDSDFRRLAHMDFKSRELEIITADIDWDVESFALSEDGSRAAFEVNEDAISQLYLMDPTTREYRRVERIPTGLISGLQFSPDGSRLAMTLSSSQTPSDVFTLELGENPLHATDLTRWTYSEVGGLNTAEFVVPELIHYPTFDGRKIPAFVYRPEAEGPHPVIIYIHGGPEGQSKPGFSSRTQLWIAEVGVAVISPNVRGSSGYGKDYVKLDNGFRREDSVKDIGALLDWIETQPDLDQTRVAVYGGSYGGYMVLASLTHFSDRLKGAVDIVGISNFVTFLENTQDYRRDLRRVEYGDERDPEMRAHLQKISPNNNAEKITVPLFVAQGQNDPRVPVTESQQIVESVRKAGYEVWYMNALNEGHGFRKKENRDLYEQIVVMFFREHLVDETSEGEP
jgi:dipeptidyl aminopeptidase/acylaminoacyl peptidase